MKVFLMFLVVVVAGAINVALGGSTHHPVLYVLSFPLLMTAVIVFCNVAGVKQRPRQPVNCCKRRTS